MKMMKKRNNKKGFTLIELIVVIAILAILALIAIPRLAGFTNKAKESNDRELVSIVAHSLQTLIASGDIIVNSSATAANRTVTIDDTGVGTALTYALPTGITLRSGLPSGTTLKNLLDPLVGDDKKFQRANSATIVVQDDGDISIETDVAVSFPTN